MWLAALTLDLATFLAFFQLTAQENHERGTIADVIDTCIAEQISSERSPITNILFSLYVHVLTSGYIQ